MALNISEFLNALNEGEQAKAAVPALQAQVTDLQAKLDAAQRHNQGLEENIQSYKSTIDGLNEKVRSLVVERDDASFRGLEVQDKLDTLLKAVRAVGGTLHDASDRADPPKPAEPAQQPVQAPSVLTQPLPFGEGGGGLSQPLNPEPKGQSEGNPTASQAGSSPNAMPLSAESSTTATPKQPETYEAPPWPAPEMKPVVHDEDKSDHDYHRFG